MTEPLFDRLTVIGLGLLGGSVALATRERGLAREVVGVDRHLSSADPNRVCPLAVEEADPVGGQVLLGVVSQEDAQPPDLH